MTDFVISEEQLREMVFSKYRKVRDNIWSDVRSRPLSEELTEAYREGYGDGRDATITELGEVEFVAKKAERVRVLKQVVTAMSTGEQCPHNFCINDQMNCIDCWWQWVESLRSEQP